MLVSDLAAITTVIAFFVTLISILFSARRYISIRNQELASERFKTYHGIVKAVSKGSDEDGVLKLVSQVDYIYELRNFKEYSELSQNLLGQLRERWKHGEDPAVYKTLKEAIDDTLSALQKK
ncbi:hypothetical protein FIU82_15160 [Pseudoalteromonas sp. THAF3]|uniref:hypothetical protein n=1 Tax=Pseudoalteromonas sp. THAF3 TaxID=2587843 RepID=UPI001269104F|nr:hypothetical protein [Pseudoalteromonas sp. THAF3]QFU06326.1 hypothetical protein FIU82_15160 [Pseudoalteromonas sp. THAF3]